MSAADPDEQAWAGARGALGDAHRLLDHLRRALETGPAGELAGALSAAGIALIRLSTFVRVRDTLPRPEVAGAMVPDVPEGLGCATVPRESPAVTPGELVPGLASQLHSDAARWAAEEIARDQFLYLIRARGMQEEAQADTP